MRIASSWLLVVAAALAGCGGGADCPGLSVGMQSLAAQASRSDLEVCDATGAAATRAGNDIAGGAPAPVLTRTLDRHSGATLQLKAGNYIIVMHAFDAGGAFIGSACEADVFTPGQHACVSIGLSTPMVDGDGGVPDLALGGGGGGGSGGGGSDGGGGSTDMGAAVFAPQTSGVTSDLYEVWSAGGGTVYVVGVSGVIIKTTDSGATWTKQTTNTTQDLEGVWGSSATDVWAVGRKGTVLHTTDGSTWTSVSLSTGNDVYDVWGAGATDVYLVGASGLVRHWNGSSFSSVNVSAGMTYLNCVWGASGSDVYIFGGNGLALHGSAANGFNKLGSPISDALYYGWGSPSGNDIWVPSNNTNFTAAQLWHSSDHGASWQSQMMTVALGAVWVSASGHAFVVGNQIWESINGGTWNAVSGSPGSLFGIGGDTDGTAVWAVGQGGTILHRP